MSADAADVVLEFKLKGERSSCKLTTNCFSFFSAVLARCFHMSTCRPYTARQICAHCGGVSACGNARAEELANELHVRFDSLAQPARSHALQTVAHLCLSLRASCFPPLASLAYETAASAVTPHAHTLWRETCGRPTSQPRATHSQHWCTDLRQDRGHMRRPLQLASHLKNAAG